MLLYAEEHDGSLFSLEDEQDKFWFDLIAPYLEHDKVMRCPRSRPNSDKIDDVIFGTRLRAWRVNGTEGGYAMNGWLFTGGRLIEDNVAPADSEKLYEKLSGMDSPGEVPIIGDSNWFVSWPRATDTMPADLERGTPPDADPKNYMGRFCIPRHDRGKRAIINLGFADGHVEKKRLDELWSLKWHREFEASKRPPKADPVGE